jgi:inosine-uridine nucleoside N-ribohydrolase
MSADEVRERFQTPLLRPVLDFSEVWFQRYKNLTFHDPLAATTLFDDQICTFTRGQVDVELASRAMYGKTHWSAGEDGPHEVALEVNAQRFIDHYFGVMSAAQ